MLEKSTLGRGVGVKRQSRNGAETKMALYQSARTCFYQKGYFDTSVRDIVEQADSKLGLFTYHFDSKEALAIMVYREYIDKLYAMFRRSLQSLYERSEPLFLTMLEYRAHLKSLTINENVARFCVELSTTRGYLEQNYRYKEEYFLKTRIPELSLNRYWSNEDTGSVFISLAAGMELQLCRDLFDGKIKIPIDDALDIYFETYYFLQLRDRKMAAACIQRSKQALATVEWGVREPFEPYVIRIESETGQE